MRSLFADVKYKMYSFLRSFRFRQQNDIYMNRLKFMSCPTGVFWSTCISFSLPPTGASTYHLYLDQRMKYPINPHTDIHVRWLVHVGHWMYDVRNSKILLLGEMASGNRGTRATLCSLQGLLKKGQEGNEHWHREFRRAAESVFKYIPCNRVWLYSHDRCCIVTSFWGITRSSQI